jgi:hypothetical protein
MKSNMDQMHHFDSNSCKTKTGCKKPKALLLSSSQIHGLHTWLNILGKQSNRGDGGELAIQSCKLIETEISFLND